MNQTTEGDHHANPYTRWFRSKAREFSGISPNDTRQARSPFDESNMVHIRSDSEWVNANVANALLAICASAPEGTLPPNAAEFFEDLHRSSWDDRWYHGEQGMGDKNTDRFVMLPFLEAFLMARNLLDPALREKWEERITGILEFQYRKFGELGQSTKVYPNMDFYYCAIMMHGWHLFGDARWSSEFERYISHLEKSQFAGGGWTYIKGTNECANYHQLNVCVLGRILQLTGHDAARRQMERTVEFYPATATPTGILEGHTDVWWKHDWKQPGSFPLDIVSSLTGDGQNRTLGDLLRDRTMHWLDQVAASNMRGTETGILYAYYASLVWREVEPKPIPGETFWLDSNIRGPRVHTKGWSWAATSGYQCDTVAGAVAHDLIDGRLCALLAVIPEIPYDPTEAEARTAGPNNRWDFAVLPAGAEGRSQIEGTSTSFEIEYQPESCRSFWKGPAVRYDWRVRQRWQMEGNALRGSLRLTSLQDQSSPLPVVRIRLGRGHELQTLSENTYRYGCFVLSLEPGDFIGRIVREVPTMALEVKKDAREILVIADPDGPPAEPRPVARDQAYSMALRLEYSP